MLRRVWKKLRAALLEQLGRRTPGENAFLVLVPVVGVVTGFACLAIAHLIEIVQSLFWGTDQGILEAAENSAWYLRIAIPVAGGALVAATGWLLKSETRGSGTGGTIQAIALKGGEISLRKESPAVATGILTVASGGALGREGPMIEFTVSVASWLGRRFGVSRQHLQILVCCAAASAIAAVYNTPIGAPFFVMEILIGNFALEIFGPVVISSVISTLIFRSSMGDLPRFQIPHYLMASHWEILAYLGLGIVGGLFSVFFIRAMYWTDDLFAKSSIPKRLRPIVGFALLGVIGCLFPHVYGNGYEASNMVLHENLSIELLLLLPFAKLAAIAFTRGSGGAGGVFTPTLMLGAAVGGAFGYAVHACFPGATAGHGAYALVGMGALLAGTTHAPITAILMIFEQTDSYEIILPLMFVCIVSNLTARLLQRESFHMEGLRRRGISLPRGPEGSVMQNLKVGDLMHEAPPYVRNVDRFPAIVEHFLRVPHNWLYVVGPDERFLGAIPLHVMKDMLHLSDSLPAVIAQDLIDERFDFVTPQHCLADTMEKFWKQDSERLPVVSDDATRRLVGWISKRDLIGIYNQEILRKRQLMTRFTMPTEEGVRGGYLEIPEGFQMVRVPVHAAFSGRTLRALAPRTHYGIYVIQLQRAAAATGRREIEMATPESILRAGDRLIVLGPPEGIQRFEAGILPEELLAAARRGE